MDKKIRQYVIDEIYKRKFFENMSIDDVKTLGWSSIKSQEYRFKILLEIGVSTDDTILDVGCGYGDLSKNVKNYVGIDIRKLAIDIASKRYCDKKFFNCDIFEINDNYDWIIASGIFCFNSYDWYEYTKKTINKMYNLCNKGISINFLSDISPNARDNEMKYTKIEEILEIIIKNTNKFTIRHDYLNNDMSVYLYR